MVSVNYRPVRSNLIIGQKKAFYRQRIPGPSWNILGSGVSKRDSVRAPIQFRREGQPQHLNFFSRTDPPIFTSIGLLLLDRSNETSWVSSFPALKSISHSLPRSTVSRSSDSSSEANSNCCHWSDAWSHLE